MKRPGIDENILSNSHSKSFNILKVNESLALEHYQITEEHFVEKKTRPSCPLCLCDFSQSVIADHLVACGLLRNKLYKSLWNGSSVSPLETTSFPSSLHSPPNADKIKSTTRSSEPPKLDVLVLPSVC